MNGYHVNPDRSGVYHCCQTGAVLVEVDRCVTSVATDCTDHQQLTPPGRKIWKESEFVLLEPTSV